MELRRFLLITLLPTRALALNLRDESFRNLQDFDDPEVATKNFENPALVGQDDPDRVDFDIIFDPEEIALDWFNNDPNLASFSQERKAQRLALAHFFYATGGENWSNNSGWLSYGTNECDWFSKIVPQAP